VPIRFEASVAVVNISCYKFVSLVDRETLKLDLTARCQALALKGTILLAPEGINIFLAGARAAIDAIVAHLRADARFADLQPKESVSDAPPFNKLRVRLKREIITMKQPLVQPEAGRAPAVAPRLLQTWLDRGCDDEGRPLLLLDTRNDYEVAAGSFVGAIDYRLASFGEFPARVAPQIDAFAGKTVVSFCTGGIRCEKAAIHMKALGVERVYQLDGGILKYFEDVGGAHYRGDCFVFDARSALKPDLQPA
jgi:Predicted sulfurtransferase